MTRSILPTRNQYGLGSSNGRSLTEELHRSIDAIDLHQSQQTYLRQNEFVFFESFLPRATVERYLIPEVDRVRPHVHRNYIPKHKKGGSVSFYTLREKAPGILSLYHSTDFINFLSQLVGAHIMPCPESDPHACALYFYTEPGDHIGFHYDTSYYKGIRYTVLLGLVQESENCQLVCQLYKDDSQRKTIELRLATPPGTMTIFNGDRLWHAVTPLGQGEERIMLTMQYVTNQEMRPFKRFVSNMKDAIAYFGFSQVLLGKRFHR